MAQRVLITGISRHLAAKLAQRLERDHEVESIVGVDLEEPEVDLERTEFVRADIRNPLIVKVLQASDADTLVHLSIIATPTRVGGRSVMKEINVIGSLQLFAASQKAKALRKVVMKSTTAVYGAGPNDPAVFTEEMGMRSAPSSGYARDAMEIEQSARDYGRRRRAGMLTILRFANFMGSEIETPLTRYFLMPVVPTPLGFDPRIQFIHEDDAVEALYRAVREDHSGIFNVAADGVLLLSQAIRICGKPSLPVPLPLATPLARAMRGLGLIDVPTDQLQFLVFGRVSDNQRLKREFGLSPKFTTRQALEEFVTGQKFRRMFTPDRAERWERDIYEFLSRTRAEGTGAPRGDAR
ncbi:MAG TPA: NAD-dependent epimerase/dehydratase family protein [Actinomycetota bacterium]